jgi:hypothetical protein
MDAFVRELMDRSPLAACVLELSDFIFAPDLLKDVWEEYRGRCYEDVLRFEDFLRLMRDALVQHGGSAHRLFVELERRGVEPINESNFYRKLARTPVELSRALLRRCTQSMSGLMPGPATVLSSCFDGFTVLACDGKKIKNAAKRLKPTRGYGGRLLGAKALVAMDLRNGMAVAMSDSLDGMVNDVPLVPALMEQLREIFAGPVLSVWDRQFDDVRTLGRLAEREGDAYVVRMTSRHLFAVESSVETRDDQGRKVTDQIGLMGEKKLRVRRLTLEREGEENIVVLTNLMDSDAFVAVDLLGLYRLRWGIEQMFQQVTETFSLSNLIGSSPRAVLLQFAYCLLLYNMVQLVKAYVAEDGGVSQMIVSTFHLFEDMKRELQAWAYHGDGTWERVAQSDARGMAQRMRELLRGSWDAVGYTKASDKKARPKRPPPIQLRGGYTSVQRLIQKNAGGTVNAGG